MMGTEDENMMGMAPRLYRYNVTSLLASGEEEKEVVMVGLEEEEEETGLTSGLYRRDGTNVYE